MFGLALVLALVVQAPSCIVDAAAPCVKPLRAADGVPGLRATFLVRATPEVVLETLWDVRRFRSIFPDIQELEVVEMRGEESADVRFYVNAVLARVSYTLRRDLDRTLRTVVWRSIAGDLKSVRGSWTVIPTPEAGVSQVVYTSFVDLGFAPSGLYRDLALGKVKEMAQRIRAAVK